MYVCDNIVYVRCLEAHTCTMMMHTPMHTQMCVCMYVYAVLLVCFYVSMYL
jgi:hypothetical protein